MGSYLDSIGFSWPTEWALPALPLIHDDAEVLQATTDQLVQEVSGIQIVTVRYSADIVCRSENLLP